MNSYLERILYGDVDTEEGTPTLYKDTFNNKKAYFFNRENWEDMLIDTSSLTEDEMNKLLNSDDKSFSTNMRSIETKDGTRRVLQVKVDESDKVVTAIDNGFYNLGYSDNYGWFLYEEEISTGDNFIELGNHLKEIRESITTFYDRKNVYEECGLKHKKGVLLYGPPGTGKSTILREFTKQYKDDAVIIFVDTSFPTGLIKNLKNFKQNYIFIFEEFTQLMTSEDTISKLLLFLDGELSLDNQLVLATTNYPEHLPENLVSRPGRFDDLIHFDDPDAETRKIYLESLGETVDDELIRNTKGFSLAYLREIFLSSKIHNKSLMEMIEANKRRKKLVKKNFASSTESIGLV